MIVILAAFYFGMLIDTQDWPVVVGPYEVWEECASVREYLDRRGYETDGCYLMPYPQESVYLSVGDIPHMTKVQSYIPVLPQESWQYYDRPPSINEPSLLLDPNRPDAAVLLLPGFPHLLMPLMETLPHLLPYRNQPQGLESPQYLLPGAMWEDLTEGLDGQLVK